MGSIPDGVCELELDRLNADCLPSANDGDVAVTCSCCTQCCAIEEVLCVNITTTTTTKPPKKDAAPIVAPAVAPNVAPAMVLDAVP